MAELCPYTGQGWPRALEMSILPSDVPEGESWGWSPKPRVHVEQLLPNPPSAARPGTGWCQTSGSTHPGGSSARSHSDT